MAWVLHICSPLQREGNRHLQSELEHAKGAALKGEEAVGELTSARTALSTLQVCGNKPCWPPGSEMHAVSCTVVFSAQMPKWERLMTQIRGQRNVKSILPAEATKYVHLVEEK